MAYADYDIQTRQSSGLRKGKPAAAYRELSRPGVDKLRVRVTISVYTRSGQLPGIEPSWVVECRKAEAVHYVRRRIRELMLELDRVTLKTEDTPADPA